MLLPSSRFKIFMYPKAFDMRSGYDRLAMICREELGLNPYSGALFLFFNKTLTRAKIFFFDGSGSQQVVCWSLCLDTMTNKSWVKTEKYSHQTKLNKVSF